MFSSFKNFLLNNNKFTDDWSPFNFLPTDASVGKKLKGLQSSVNLLLFNKKFLNELNKNSADLDLKNDSPNIINGF